MNISFVWIDGQCLVLVLVTSQCEDCSINIDIFSKGKTDNTKPAFTGQLRTSLVVRRHLGKDPRQ